MSQNAAEFILRVRDETGNVIKEFAGELDDLVDAQQAAAKAGKKAGDGQKEFGDKSSEASGKVSKLRSSADNLAGRLKVVAAGAAAAAAAVGAFAVKAASNGEELIKLGNDAKRLGLDLETFQAASKVAFNQAGVEDFTAGMDDLNERLQDFVTNGAGEAADVLKRFNLDAEELARKNPLEQLLSIADALKGISNNDRAQILDQLGSDNLRNLEPLLRGGREEVEKMIENVKDLGLVLTNLESEQLAALGRKFREIKDESSGLFNRISSQASPAILAIIEETERLAGKTEGFGKSWETVGNIILFVSGIALDKVNDIKINTLEAIVAFRQMQVAATKVKYFGRLAGDTEEATAALDEVKKKLEELVEAGDPSERLLQIRANKIQEAVERAKQAKKEIEDAGKDTSGVNRSTTDGEEGEESKAAKKEADAIKRAEEIKANAREQLAKIAAEARKVARQAELDTAIDNINQEKALRLNALEQEEALEKKSAAQVARERIKIETDANNRIGELRRQIIQADIDNLQTQLTQQQELISTTEAGDQRHADALIRAAELEAKIEQKKREQSGVLDEIVRKNALVTEELAAQAEIEQKKAADKAQAEANKQAEKSAADRKRQAEEAARQQEQLDREVYAARQDLLRLEGNALQANLNDIDQKYGALLSKLAADSEEAAIVEKLIDKSKAKATLDDLNEEINRLERRLQRGEISVDDFRDQLAPKTEQATSLAEQIGDPRLIEDTEDRVTDLGNSVDAMFQAGRVTGEAFKTQFVDAFASLIDGTKSVSEAVRDMAAQILAELARMIAQQLIFNALAGASGFGGGFQTGVGGGQFHGGGVVGRGGTSRTVDPRWYAFAPRYHTGGIAGLKPNEVPAVLEKGEEVLTANDPRHRDNLGGGAQQNITVHNTLDNNSVVEAINGPAGERVIQNMVRAMRDEIKSF